jgi:hypothetical protein
MEKQWNPEMYLGVYDQVIFIKISKMIQPKGRVFSANYA